MKNLSVNHILEKFLLASSLTKMKIPKNRLKFKTCFSIIFQYFYKLKFILQSILDKNLPYDIDFLCGDSILLVRPY